MGIASPQQMGGPPPTPGTATSALGNGSGRATGSSLTESRPPIHCPPDMLQQDPVSRWGCRALSPKHGALLSLGPCGTALVVHCTGRALIVPQVQKQEQGSKRRLGATHLRGRPHPSQLANGVLPDPGTALGRAELFSGQKLSLLFTTALFAAFPPFLLPLASCRLKPGAFTRPQGWGQCGLHSF